ncbi:UNVERIFIED_CONTAM: flagellar assembly protein FliX [Methylobacteriaceae bacterium AG10]|uniref:Flagellar assembly protein FliX n=1 Tax=Methylorubrum podarium TaxID=200476 RepID=A0ABV1QM07_9HYPH|nr:flagellar assembly protein FliX [Methylobacteriaceae bacterium AG10]
MRVDTRFAAAAAGALNASRRAAAPGAFAPAGTEEAPRAATAGTSQTGMLTGLDALLTLQGQDGAEAQKERRRRSVQRGHDLLDGLDRLKAALIGGRVATRDLQAIAGRLAERMAESGDPRLDGLVAEIELRASVELAKLEAARGI